jgi:cytochrome c oxidase assembly protein subunit 15
MRRPAVSPPTFHRLTVLVAVALGAIVVTGAAVRLTGSGLGCPTWPRCTATSYVAPLGYHALVEFVNRVVTSLVGVFVAAVAVAALLRSPRRRDLGLLAWSLVAGFVGQAVVGGLSVLYDLAPAWVLAHFLLSMLMIWAGLVLAHRAHPRWAPCRPAARRELVLLGRLLVAAAAVVLVLGTVTTGTGPHAGDGAHHVRRFGFPLERVTQLHADAALLLTGLVVATLFAVRLGDAPRAVRRRAAIVGGAVLLQVAIGYTQYFLNLPPGVVELHVAGATVLWAATVWLQLGFTAPVAVPGSDELADRERPEQQGQIRDRQVEQRHGLRRLAPAYAPVQPDGRADEDAAEQQGGRAVEPAAAERHQQ